MKGLFIPEITAEMFRNGCLESIEALMAEGEIYDIEYPRWIPVTERLPEVGDTYIVTIEYKGKFEGVDAADFVFTGDGYIDGKWDTWNDWVEDKSEFYHITAWMPLPKPYEDKETEEERNRRLCRENYAAQMESLGYDADGNPNNRNGGCYKAHEMIEDRLHCKCGCEMVITGEWEKYDYCPKCGAKAEIYITPYSRA